MSQGELDFFVGPSILINHVNKMIVLSNSSRNDYSREETNCDENHRLDSMTQSVIVSPDPSVEVPGLINACTSIRSSYNGPLYNSRRQYTPVDLYGIEEEPYTRLSINDDENR